MTDSNITTDNMHEVPEIDASSNTIVVWFEEVSTLIAEGHIVEFAPKGYSMWPTLRPDTDTVCLEAAKEYRQSDIILAMCRRPHGIFMHRIIDIRSQEVVLMGDSNLYQTEQCRYNDIVGKVTVIRRNGRDISDSAYCRLLTRIQNMTPILRRLFVRAVKLYLKHRGNK